MTDRQTGPTDGEIPPQLEFDAEKAFYLKRFIKRSFPTSDSLYRSGQSKRLKRFFNDRKQGLIEALIGERDAQGVRVVEEMILKDLADLCEVQAQAPKEFWQSADRPFTREYWQKAKDVVGEALKLSQETIFLIK